jgi:ABC-type nitrate/sulfonate/bicarbonate transport system permease component
MGAANMNPDLAASRAVTRPVARAGPRRDRLVARVLGRRAIPFVGAAVVAIVGEMVVRAGWAPSSVAAPTDVWREFINDPNSLWFEVQPTLSASLVGFAYATGIALAVSVLTAVVPWATGVIYRVSVVTYSVPLIALTPVLLVWIGNGQSLRITIAAIASFFPVAVGCIQGFRAVDPGRDELLSQLAASTYQRFRFLVLPESLPYVFAGLKVGAASAVLGAIISEWSGATQGLGVAMITALSGYNPPGVWLTIVASSALTAALYLAVGVLERLTIRWEYDRDAVAAKS